MIKNKPNLDLSYRSQITDQKRRQRFANNELQKRMINVFMESAAFVKPKSNFVKIIQNRKAAFSRIRNRCILTGRSTRFNHFRLSRISFRQLAGLGMLPGITKRVNR